MRVKLYGVSLLIFLLLGYALIFPSFENARKDIKKLQTKGLILPPIVVKILSLEFRTIASDYFFVRTTQFYGAKLENRALATKDDWDWLYRNLDVVTALDPYFEDPYYFGNAIFTWGTAMYCEANKLLMRGSEARTWDWILPFYLGFNKFYFLNEYKSGADYLLLASKRPGAWTGLPSLAARLYNKEGRTENAIAFLLTFWENEKDVRVKKGYEIRIDALRKILYLEKAVTAYKKNTGRLPQNLKILVEAGLIREMPQDPYGGTFYIDKNGSIKTTSKLAFKPRPLPNKENDPK